MTEKTVNVGDVVAWANVPDGALVRTAGKNTILRVQDEGWTVNARGSSWAMFAHWSDGDPAGGGWPWNELTDHPVTVVALGLTGEESAEDLRALAERFEVREAMLSWTAEERAMVCQHESAWGMLDEVAERLHAAGWRSGMTAEDAARLLAAQDRMNTAYIEAQEWVGPRPEVDE